MSQLCDGLAGMMYRRIIVRFSSFTFGNMLHLLIYVAYVLKIHLEAL